MDIAAVVRLMKRVHDEEGWNLGSASTRDQRNYFLERACGIVHWGHPVYNLTPDPKWHCKDPDGPNGGRPPSDDVVVSMPDRTMYDCIPGCGADGYYFNERAGGEHLTDQFIFVPSKPKMIDGPGVAHTPGSPAPAAIYPPYPGDAPFDAIAEQLFPDYARKGEAPNAGMGRWFGRTIYDWLVGNEKTLADSQAKHRKEWCAVLGIPVV